MAASFKTLANRVAGALLLAALLAAPGKAQQQANTGRQIVVSLPDRKLAVVENGKVVRVFAVSVGANNSPSPRGNFRIVNRIANPTYYRPGVVIGPGRDNPIGPRWIGLSQKGYGIHGTNEPRSVGKAASHGCIRLRNTEIKLLFSMVRVGDEVQIRGERDEEAARIFGDRTEHATVAEFQAATNAAGQ
jgi:lipoprotein-anchoring transpeptidase ErfK/SrfK